MSLTQGGVLVSVLGLIVVHFLGQWGISEVCSNELVKFIPVVIGGLMSWWGRFRLGGVTLLGTRK